MKILEVLSIKKYILIAAVSSLVFAFIYVYAQVFGILGNIDLWIRIIPWYNALLFVIFAALFGIAIAFQIYSWKQPKVCKVNSKTVGASSGAAILGLFVAQCPACATLGALILPASIFTIVFVKYSALINILNIGLLLFVIYYLGGFRNE